MAKKKESTPGGKSRKIGRNSKRYSYRKSEVLKIHQLNDEMTIVNSKRGVFGKTKSEGGTGIQGKGWAKVRKPGNNLVKTTKEKRHMGPLARHDRAREAGQFYNGFTEEERAEMVLHGTIACINVGTMTNPVFLSRDQSVLVARNYLEAVEEGSESEDMLSASRNMITRVKVASVLYRNNPDAIDMARNLAMIGLEGIMLRKELIEKGYLKPYYA